jgi:hypothetical protein
MPDASGSFFIGGHWSTEGDRGRLCPRVAVDRVAVALWPTWGAVGIAASASRSGLV